jgi:class 3 adenylate cyclase/tetratricopeptide (TPR) repeat protein
MTFLGTSLSDEQGEMLKPYIPRLLIEWLRDSPRESHRVLEGSLAFVDISGFTALTERLARRGKVGAELLHDTLDDVFRALLDEAYAWGAGLVKWGGDALLLLFDGPGHEHRATRAAWELQREMERVGRIRIAGDVTLRMSIGVGTGPIDFFLVGSVHREMLVLGPTASETVAIEAAVEAGGIGVSRALAQRLDASCVQELETGLSLIVGPPEAARGRAPDVVSVRAADVAACIPVAARDHVLLAHSEPEHRTIAVAFIDLIGTDELLDRLGPDRLGRALHESVSTIQEAAVQHGVPFNLTDIANGSVKVLLTAGAPTSTGHDEEQMLRMLRAVMDEPGTIAMRAGVNAGRVFTGDFGPPYRRTYAVFGDAINTAARVMGRAEPGQILATDTVLARSRTTFATTPIEPFRAKGKDELVGASIVGSIVGRREVRGGAAPFVGRGKELEALLAMLDDVRKGITWTAEIAGVSGIGKSRLARELAERSTDFAVLHADCEEYESSTPYFALRAPLRALIGVEPGTEGDEVAEKLRGIVDNTDASLAPWVPLLGIVLGLELAPTPETRRLDRRFLREAVADITDRFIAAVATSPVLLIVDDAQFIDDASAELLRRVFRSDATAPRALLVTHSEPTATWPPDANDLQRLAFTLLPLAEQDAVRLVELVTDEQPLRPHETESIARRSGGSPLFLLELLDVACASGGADALPESIEALAVADIDRLSPSDRTVLRYASVLGPRFDPRLLARAVHPEAQLDAGIWDRLQGLVAYDETGAMRFRSTLLRDAAYEGLPFRRRRELHARAALAIESSPSSPEDEAPALAFHFYEGGRRNEAWHYARLAGDRARAVAANIEAAKFYELALRAGRGLRAVSDRERADVYIALGAVREAAGLFERSFEALQHATGLLAHDPVERAHVFSLRTRARVRTGSYTSALRETTAGLKLVDEMDTKAALAARATLRAMRGEIRWFQGHPREAIRIAELAVDEARQSDAAEALARAYTALDGSYQMLGHPEKAIHERMALEIYTRLGHVRSRGITELNLGVQAYADGRWDEAADLYRRAEEDCLHAGDRPNAAIAKANLGELLVSRGALDEAERLLTEARRVLRSSNYAPFALFAETQLGRVALARGLAVEALQLLRSVVDRGARDAYAAAALEGAIYFAQAATACQRPHEGLSVLEQAAAQAGDEAVLYSVAVGRVRAAALRALGDLDEAAASVEKALASARRQSLLYEQMLLLTERSELARASGSDPSRADLREAKRLAQILGCPAPSYVDVLSPSISE